MCGSDETVRVYLLGTKAQEPETVKEGCKREVGCCLIEIILFPLEVIASLFVSGWIYLGLLLFATRRRCKCETCGHLWDAIR